MTSKEWCERLGAYDVRRDAHEDFWTYCPCHGDQSPRMHVARMISGGIMMKCFGCGATGPDVCRALGLSERELDGQPAKERRRRRRVDQTIYGATEPLYCLACGSVMRVNVHPDRLAGGYIAQASCESGGCGMWLTRAVHAATQREAEELLRRSARESWHRTLDKIIHAKSASAGAFEERRNTSD